MAAGFEIAEGGKAWNTYSAYYLTRLLPLPVPFKRLLLWLLQVSGAGRLRTWVPLGNLYQIATKPR